MWKILSLSVCGAIAFYASTILANYSTPFLLVGLRSLISGTLLLTYNFFKEDRIKIENRKHIYYLIIAMLFGFVVPFLLTSSVLDKLPPVDMSVIAAIEPILTYIFASIFFKEKINKKQVLFLLLGSAFSFIAVIAEAGVERVSLVSWQEIIVFASAIAFAIGWLAVGFLMQFGTMSEHLVTGAGFTVTGILAVIAAVTIEAPHFYIGWIPIILMLIVVVLGDFITTRTRARLSTNHSATLLSLIAIFSPFIMALHEIIFDRRHYSFKFFLILIPAILCFYAFYKEEIKTKRIS